MGPKVLLAGHPKVKDGSDLVLHLFIDDSLRKNITIEQFLTIVLYHHSVAESSKPCGWIPSSPIYATDIARLVSRGALDSDDTKVLVMDDEGLREELGNHNTNFIVSPSIVTTPSLSHLHSTSSLLRSSVKRSRSVSDESPTSHVCATQTVFTRTGTNPQAQPTFITKLDEFFSTERPILLDRSPVIQHIETAFSDNPLSKIVLLHHFDSMPLALVMDTIECVYDIQNTSPGVSSIVPFRAVQATPKFRIWSIDFFLSSPPKNLEACRRALRRVLAKSFDQFCVRYSIESLSLTETVPLEDTMSSLSSRIIKDYDDWTNSLFLEFAQNSQRADTSSETSMATWMAKHLFLPLRDCPAIHRMFCFGRLPALLQEIRFQLGAFWNLSHCPALNSAFYVSEAECKVILRSIYTVPNCRYIDQRVAELKEFLGSYASCPTLTPSARRGHLRMSWLDCTIPKVLANAASPDNSLRIWLQKNVGCFPLIPSTSHAMLIAQAYFSVSPEFRDAFRECLGLNIPLEYTIDHFTTLSYSMLPIRHSGPILPTESAISTLHVPILGGDDIALVALLVGLGLLTGSCDPQDPMGSFWSPPNKHSKSLLQNILNRRITPHQHMHMPGDIDALFNAVVVRLERRTTRETRYIRERIFQEIVLTMWEDSGSNHCDVPVMAEFKLFAGTKMRFLDLFDKKRLLELKAACGVDIAAGTHGIKEASENQIDTMLTHMADAIQEGKDLPATYWDNWTETPLNDTDNEGNRTGSIKFKNKVPHWVDIVMKYKDWEKDCWAYERLDTRFGKGVAQAKIYQRLLALGKASPKALSSGGIFIKITGKEGFIKAEVWMLVAGKHIIRHKLPDLATEISYQTGPL